MSQLPAAKSDDRDQWNFYPFPRMRDSGQHPIHLNRVSELEDHLIDQLIRAERSRDGVISVSGGIFGMKRFD